MNPTLTKRIYERPLTERIYERHLAALRRVTGDGTWMDESAVRMALWLALTELADRLDGALQPAASSALQAEIENDLVHMDGALQPAASSALQAEIKNDLVHKRQFFNDLPRDIRLQLVQEVFVAADGQLTTIEIFNANKPSWMPPARTLTQSFKVPFNELATLANAVEEA